MSQINKRLIITTLQKRIDLIERAIIISSLPAFLHHCDLFKGCLLRSNSNPKVRDRTALVGCVMCETGCRLTQQQTL